MQRVGHPPARIGSGVRRREGFLPGVLSPGGGQSLGLLGLPIPGWCPLLCPLVPRTSAFLHLHVPFSSENLSPPAPGHFFPHSPLFAPTARCSFLWNLLPSSLSSCLAPVSLPPTLHTSRARQLLLGLRPALRLLSAIRAAPRGTFHTSSCVGGSGKL